MNAAEAVARCSAAPAASVVFVSEVRSLPFKLDDPLLLWRVVRVEALVFPLLFSDSPQPLSVTTDASDADVAVGVRVLTSMWVEDTLGRCSPDTDVPTDGDVGDFEISFEGLRAGVSLLALDVLARTALPGRCEEGTECEREVADPVADADDEVFPPIRCAQVSGLPAVAAVVGLFEEGGDVGEATALLAGFSAAIAAEAHPPEMSGSRRLYAMTSRRCQS